MESKAVILQPNGRLVASVVLFSAAVVALLLLFTGIHLSLAGFGMATIVAPLTALAANRLGHRHAVSPTHRRIADFFGYLAAFSAVCLLGVLSSYPAAAETSGFHDRQLEMIDRLLHFDWIYWYLEVSQHRALQVIGAALYAGIYVTPIVILGYFAVREDEGAAHRFILTFWLAALLTLLLFPLFPAEGPLAFLWHGRIPYMPTSALYQEQLIPALRDHRLRDIDLGALRGLVCAPSFHAAAATIYMAFGWRAGGLRWPIVLVNVAMLCVTPIEGTHYLTDLIAGIMVALFAIGAVRTLTTPNAKNVAALRDQGRPTLV